ncbi:CPBP family intramembrane metalloprotease [Bacillus velezensis]|nr:CPBP family intramembrane glutamic endopeptidase [Bacillus velezensis]NYZ54616.1 CPBP family intramembrane metalloprotease [Bacillus amyloliquefaciens]MEC0973520.1 CPBP family intramembrane metalloprotease [Bacillus velezensis]MED4704071.1 CPBP family intramembrane metalloprotease [Bacillus velezensis]QWC48775.1 CPBP family intramembrane metalloprotease [Bacillus velezensis]QXI96051.1 CPBP family intramembrane metalloprotease [Bacillus velezensis]
MQLYATQLLILAVSGVIGFFFFTDIHDFLKLWHIRDDNIIWYGVTLAVLVIFADLAVMKWCPSHLYDDGGINVLLFKNRPVLHILFLTLLISFSEEILFRGVLQTHIGLWAASFIFTVLHFRYLAKWLLFMMVAGISLLLGLIYEWTGNLFVPVTAHFIIDAVFACQIRFQYVRRGLHDGNVKS